MGDGRLRPASGGSREARLVAAEAFDQPVADDADAGHVTQLPGQHQPDLAAEHGLIAGQAAQPRVLLPTRHGRMPSPRPSATALASASMLLQRNVTLCWPTCSDSQHISGSWSRALIAHPRCGLPG